MARLTLRYRYDGTPEQVLDDFGRLTLSVDAGFCGEGGFWVQWQDVKEFGEKLATYPLVAPVTAKWGYRMQEGEDLILSVEIGPANRRGDLFVRVEIVDDLHDHGHRDRVRSSFQTNYPQLETFRREIAQVMDGKATEAVLEGH